MINDSYIDVSFGRLFLGLSLFNNMIQIKVANANNITIFFIQSVQLTLGLDFDEISLKLSSPTCRS
uniref:Uncharacterized protein n=1 Tax=Lepeophtheirus salmonis TaxID=72036 RepID=A0A0K2SWX8_LEPSM